MFYITQFIYIKKDQEEVFHQFEDLAIPIISKYNGRLIYRVRPQENDVITSEIGLPYEIHLVEFNNESDFENFKLDEERKQFLRLKEQSITSVLMLKGSRI
jgi:uncharacterized protein (DUF1330 family)